MLALLFIYLFIYLFFYFRRQLYSDVFIGLHDISVESGWEWVDGSITNYRNFDINEPNNWLGMEDCVVIKKTTGKWNDVPCNLKLNYVCKRPNGKLLLGKQYFEFC